MSRIEWTETTWNPFAGCTLVSPGCTNCYAMRMAARLQAMGMEKYEGTTRQSGGRAVWTGQINLASDALYNPLNWKKPRLVFVNSMSDMFHDGVPAAWIESVWNIMRRTPKHTYQVLTKRSARMLEMSRRLPTLPNVWLGVSVETEKQDDRIGDLRQTNAAVRFLSLEPLLGSLPNLGLKDIDWVIVGGESGPGARPMDPDWVRDIRRKCVISNTPFFFKQWGGTRKKDSGRSLDGRMWDEMPERAA